MCQKGTSAMSSLGFSMHAEFKAGQLLRRQPKKADGGTAEPGSYRGRSPVEIYVGVALLGAAAVTLAFPDQATTVLRHFAGWLS